MTKRIFAAVLLLCLFVSVVYAQSAATVFGWPPADGSVTNAKLAEPVSVANGGTGATTAAAGLAALGGASLNGSSTVAFNASTINGVTPLTDAEKTQALVGSSTVDFEAKGIHTGELTPSYRLGGYSTAVFLDLPDIGAAGSLVIPMREDYYGTAPLLTGILSVTIKRYNYPAQSTMTTYAMAANGLSATFTPLVSVNGTGGAVGFTLGMTATGTITITHNEAGIANAYVSMSFTGARGY